MKKLFACLVLFLFAGLYIDIETDEKWRDSLTVCNASYLQRTFVVQTIVPFRPERETLYLGFGNKHFNQEKRLNSLFCSESTGKWEYSNGKRESEIGCYPGTKDNFGEHAHFVDLVFWKKPVIEPTKYSVDYREVSESTYNAWLKESFKKEGQPCEEEK